MIVLGADAIEASCAGWVALAGARAARCGVGSWVKITSLKGSTLEIAASEGAEE